MRRGPAPGLGLQAPPPPAVVDDEEERKAKTGRLGSAADRAGRRARRSERAGERRVTRPVAASTLLVDEEETRRTRSGSRKNRSQRMAVAARRKTHIEIEPPITVRSLSEAIGVKAQDLLRKLMAMNQMVTINASVDDELAVVLAMEFGSELVVVHPRTAEDEMLDAFSTTEPGEPGASAAGDHDPGTRRPRQDVAAGPNSQVERRSIRERGHHPAHRRVPGRVERPGHHVRRHARP